ncbi:MAG TPA: tripartite tricarboxylate transporter substrate-binding protein [Burkholderiales bacterium]
MSRLTPAWLRSAASSFVIAMLVIASPAALAQAWPARPVTLVVPFAAGGPTDIVARLIAPSMGRSLGQSVVVENRTGAGGTRGADLVASARADGYTILLHHNGMSTAPALYRQLRYDPLASFEYIGLVVDVPMTVVGRADLPPKNAAELLAWLKQNAEKVNFAHAGPGSASHACSLMVRRAIGVEPTTVAFQGTAPALVALEGGHVDLLCDQTTQTLPHIKSGKIKLYATTAKARVPMLRDTPTLIESGLKNAEIIIWHGVYAPRGTPPEAVSKLNAALRAALKDPAVVARLGDLGGQVVPESRQTPAALRDWLKAEIGRWTPIIRASGSYLD